LLTNLLVSNSQNSLKSFQGKLLGEVAAQAQAASMLQKLKLQEPPRPSSEGLLVPYMLQKGIIENAMAYCQKFLGEFKASRHDLQNEMGRKHDANVQGIQNGKDGIAAQASTWASKQQAFSQLVSGLMTDVCSEEIQEFAREDALSNDLQPPALAEAFGTLVDTHHDFWSNKCKELHNTGMSITTWLESRQVVFTNGQEAANERMLAAGSRPKFSAEPSKTEEWCAQNWQAKLDKLMPEMKEIRDWCLVEENDRPHCCNVNTCQHHQDIKSQREAARKKIEDDKRRAIEAANMEAQRREREAREEAARREAQRAQSILDRIRAAFNAVWSWFR